jgi:hypothetical protein
MRRVSTTSFTRGLRVNDRDIERNIAFGQAVADEFGYETVPVAEVYATFDRISDLVPRGFSIVKPGFYCQPINESIARVVALQAWKGGIHSPVCGVSLSFMPHAWDPALRWHKGVKAPRFDLFERNHGQYRKPDEERRLTDIGSVSHTHGGRYMYLTCLSMWTRCSAGIFNWFAGVTSIEDVVAVARQQIHYTDRRYETHAPHPRLVAIFALARLGRAEEAWAEFETYPIEWETEIGREMLAKALEQVCSGARI